MNTFHQDVWAMENTDATEQERRWKRWEADLIVELGLDVPDLDGDEDVEGYSLDMSYHLFLKGMSPADAACYVGQHREYLRMIRNALMHTHPRTHNQFRIHRMRYSMPHFEVVSKAKDNRFWATFEGPRLRFWKERSDYFIMPKTLLQ